MYYLKMTGEYYCRSCKCPDNTPSSIIFRVTAYTPNGLQIDTQHKSSICEGIVVNSDGSNAILISLNVLSAGNTVGLEYFWLDVVPGVTEQEFASSVKTRLRTDTRRLVEVSITVIPDIRFKDAGLRDVVGGVVGSIAEVKTGVLRHSIAGNLTGSWQADNLTGDDDGNLVGTWPSSNARGDGHLTVSLEKVSEMVILDEDEELVDSS
jgi:hypothetical protein